MEISARSVKAKNLRRAVGQALQQLYLASRLHLMYSEEHENVRAAYDGLAQKLAEMFIVESSLKLTVEDGYLFANEIRLRVDTVGDKAYEWVVERFAESGIASIVFRREVKSVELKKFIPVFAKAMWLEGQPAPPIQQLLVDAFIVNISVTLRSKRDEEDEGEEKAQVSARELALGLYFKMIRACAEIAEAVSHGEAITLKRARYLIQLAVDTFIEDEAALIALTRVKNHHSYLANHMANACIYSLALGNRIGLSRRQLLDLGTAGLCFDIGMALVPARVRDKPEALTTEEREMILFHPLRGADALLRAQESGGFNRICAVVAAEHHLVGYPRAVEGPPGLLTSIVAVADCYDSLTTDRPFRPGLPHAEAMKILYAGEGGHDRLLVKAFANVLGLYPAGVLVELDTGDVAIVAQQHPDPKLGTRPRVKILVDARGQNVEGQVVDLTERRSDGRFRRTIARVIEIDRGRVGTPDLLALI